MSQWTRRDWDRPWPLPGIPSAWGVPSNLQASSIPLHPSVLRSGNLSKTDYLQILADRVAWLIDLEDDPRAAQTELAHELEKRGGWSVSTGFESPAQAVSELLLSNRPFLTYSLPWSACPTAHGKSVQCRKR
jgi:hypothetical protein